MDHSSELHIEKRKIRKTQKSDFLERRAISKFVDYFNFKYGSRHIPFQCCTMRQALNRSCLALDEHRRCLILYLHKDNDELSKLICPHFVKGQIYDIIETSFNVLAWDLTDITSTTFNVILNEWSELEIVQNYITKKRAGLFVLSAIKDTVLIIAEWNDRNAHVKDILQELKEIQAITSNRKIQQNNSVQEEQVRSKETLHRGFDSELRNVKHKEHECLQETNYLVSINKCDQETLNISQTKCIEKSACLNFIVQFHSKYGNYHIPFQCCSLKDAIYNSSLAPNKERKLLLLYLHNENDKLSYLICPQFVHGEIHDILKESFDVLAWDLLSIEDGAFVAIINEWPKLDIIKDYINIRRAGLFVLFPENDTVAIISEWNRTATLNNILEELKVLKDVALYSEIRYAEKVQENHVRPKQIQQTMCDYNCVSLKSAQQSCSKDQVGSSKSNNSSPKKGKLHKKTFQKKINKNQCLEEKAYLNFLKQFQSKYGTDHIPFQQCSLQQAIKYSCLALEEYRKFLILYLHNENDELSQLICPQFARAKFYNTIVTSFNVLAWDVNSIDLDSFDAAINKWPELHIVKDYINKKHAGLFVLCRTEDTVTIISEWYKTVGNVNEILQTLLTLRKAAPDTQVQFKNKVQNRQIRFSHPRAKNESVQMRGNAIERSPEPGVNQNQSSEEKAYLSFLKRFNSKYGTNHIQFQYCSLQQAIEYSCLAPKEYRKYLILYLHNENDKLSKLICPIFTQVEFYSIIETSFDVLAWDLINMDPGSFNEIIDNWAELGIIKHYIKNKRAGLFVLRRTENTVTIISQWNADTAEVNKIFDTLLTLHEAILLPQPPPPPQPQPQYIENVSEQIGSKEFQQMMFDRLGDRDYDSFDANEHQHLKDKIGFSKFGPPSSENGYNEKQTEIIENTYKTIINQCSKYSEWKGYVVISFIYNCLEPLPSEKKERQETNPEYNEYTDILPVPLYVIRKCFDSSNPCRIFIDHDNRVYTTWSDYLEENKLHKCIMVVPKHGRYHSIRDDGQVNLETYNSPACGIGKAILKGTDIATSVIGLGAGGVPLLAAIPAIPVAPIALITAAVAGAGVGIYSMVRSSMAIHDRVTHEESMSLANSEARGAYLNIVAGTLGFVGMGATTAVSELASRGVNIGVGTRIALNTVNVANLSTGIVNIASSSYDLIDNWRNENISALSLLQFSSSVLFFGNSVYNFRTANMIVNDAQVSSMRNIQDSLRSNRHRKTFNKLYLETVRTNDGNVQAARAEVISTIRSMSNVDETLAILTRNNKLFNRQKVKFAANDGNITLNGVSVDISSMGTMSRSKTTQFIIDLPNAPRQTFEGAQKNKCEVVDFLQRNVTLNSIQTLAGFTNLLISGSYMDTFSEVLSRFSNIIREKILITFTGLLDKMYSLNIPIVDMCQQFCKDISSNPMVTVLQLVIEFLKTEMNKHEEIYRRKFNNIVQYDTAKSAIFWFEKIVNIFVNGGNINVYLMDQLVQYVTTFVTKKIHQAGQQQEREANRVRNTTEIKQCDVCKGKYYCN